MRNLVFDQTSAENNPAGFGFQPNRQTGINHVRFIMSFFLFIWMVFFFFFVHVFIHSFKYSFNSIQPSHSFPLVAISGIVAKKFSAVFSCKPCVTNRLPFSRNKGGKWLLQAAVLNHRARGVEAAAASRAAAAANAALAAVFFFCSKKRTKNSARGVFWWERCFHLTLDWLLQELCSQPNSALDYEAVTLSSTALLQRFRLLQVQLPLKTLDGWRWAGWTEGLRSTYEFPFPDFPFPSIFPRSWGEHSVGRKRRFSNKMWRHIFKMEKSSLWSRQCFTACILAVSLFQSIQSFFFLSIQDDRPDKIDCSGIVSVVFAAEANAAADTLVNNCNQTYFPHS